MLDFTKNELKKWNIELVSCLSLSECEITRPHLLNKCGITNGSVIVFAVPYLTKESFDKRNVSSYAVSRDYHILFSDIFEKLIPHLKAQYPEYIFAGFADHSPINEVIAAAKAGIGVLGTNHLLITKEHSSYVFLGEIITNADIPSCSTEISHCINCQKCVLSCPVKTDISSCLSALTQKKGDLNVEEIERIKSTGCAWGCDICQEVCPYTHNALSHGTLFTNIEFFNSEQAPIISQDDVVNMNEKSFSQRAYSWRGKNVIIRNLKITEGGNN